MADAVGAEHAFFSTCGSSLSVKAAMLAVAGVRRELLVGRDAHKSVVAGLIFSGLQPRWVTPRWDPELHLAHPPSPEQVDEAWERYPDAAGALVVSPTPYGTCADIGRHRRGLPRAGQAADRRRGVGRASAVPRRPADLGDGRRRGRLRGQRAQDGRRASSRVRCSMCRATWSTPPHLAACADLLRTTSPNVLIYAAMDGWRRQMVEHGRDLLRRGAGSGGRGAGPHRAMPGLHVLRGRVPAGRGLPRPRPAAHPDRLSASWASADIRPRTGCASTTGIDMGTQRPPPDRGDAVDRRRRAQHERLLDRATGTGRGGRDAAGPPRVSCPTPANWSWSRCTLPRDAFFGAVEQVPADDAVGRVAAEQITPYPPGIPASLPGERITAEVVDYLAPA